MEFVVEYWQILVAGMCVGGVIVHAVTHFKTLSSADQLENVKEWLLFAVTQAEGEFGGGTGQTKLRYVYDMFTTRFPFLVNIISFDKFSGLVDTALDKMKGELECKN